jgi:hypothetical protein
VEKQLAVNYKVCNRCSIEKDLSQFYTSFRKNGKVYYKSACKVCILGDRKKYQCENRAQIGYRKKQFYNENKSHVKAQQKVWRDKNLLSRIVRNAKRRSVQSRSTIPLTSQQEQQIKDFYWLAKDLTAVSGETYHVDHIVPLQGKNVCGLHVPWNLQVLPADINLSKGNRYANDA